MSVWWQFSTSVIESISFTIWKHIWLWDPLGLTTKDISSFTDFPGGSESAHNAGDPVLITRLGRSPGEGNGNQLQYSYLENPMDRGAEQATVHGISKSWTWLCNFFFFPFGQFLSYRRLSLPWGGKSQIILWSLSTCNYILPFESKRGKRDGMPAMCPPLLACWKHFRGHQRYCFPWGIFRVKYGMDSFTPFICAVNTEFRSIKHFKSTE